MDAIQQAGFVDVAAASTVDGFAGADGEARADSFESLFRLSEFQFYAAIAPDVGGLNNPLQDGLGLAHLHIPEIFQERAHLDRDSGDLGFHVPLSRNTCL